MCIIASAANKREHYLVETGNIMGIATHFYVNFVNSSFEMIIILLLSHSKVCKQ